MWPDKAMAIPARGGVELYQVAGTRHSHKVLQQLPTVVAVSV